jgi:branched-chain amino acid transport system permease protein
MDTFLQLVISGVAVGSAYGLIALGFLVIFHTTGVVNFAQGDMLMTGAIVTMLLATADVNYLLIVVAVAVLAVVLTVVLRGGLIDPLNRRRAPVFSIVVGTIALGILFEEVVAVTVGDRVFGVPPIVPDNPITVGGVALLPQTVITVLAAWAMVMLVWLFFTRTLTGTALRAIGINRNAAAVSGARVQRLVSLGVLLGIFVTVMAGLLLGPTLGASPRMGPELAVKGFAAAIVGGFNSVYWGMVAGVGLGVVEVLGSYYVSSVYAPVVAYVLLVVALLLQTGVQFRRVRRRKVATA